MTAKPPSYPVTPDSKRRVRGSVYRACQGVAEFEKEVFLCPDDLTKLFSTNRRKDVIEFEFWDSGKTVYIAVRVVNNGKKGPWGRANSIEISAVTWEPQPKRVAPKVPP